MASNTSRNTNQQDPTPETHPAQQSDLAQIIASTDDSTREPILLPKQAPQTQVLKRKEGSDDRYSNPAATTALFISDLPDDDVRGTYKIPASSPGELILELRAIFGKYIVRTEEGVDEILREFDEKTQGEDPQDVGIKEVLVDMISRKIKAGM
ncbi:MAG: hypothetical protein L6R40_006816 [Gallowayella cf. fulva]|nr:MAG: hypothetical protein L6R40_006816 [Xanthomendoza cf. fulva]